MGFQPNSAWEEVERTLNGPQKEAVAHTDGPLLILAGPGSGKTRVVTCRAARLARTVTDPAHILAITFTNKAAREMRERMAALGVARGMTVCTFHALCARLLREYCEQVGVPRNFSIVDRDDRRKVLKKAIQACSLSTEHWRPAVAEAEISRAKNEMLTAAEFADRAFDWHGKTLARIYTCYEQELANMGGLDFDDLLMRMAAALRNDAGLREELGDRFRYVLIDEYQDTNAAQYTIARLLAVRHENICATGDPDQSIYGWRGADIENILTFDRDYPSAKVIRLEENYRSTKRILAAADALIARNVERKEKSLWTENDAGPPVRVIQCEEGGDEASRVAREIEEEIRKGTSGDEIAVFYRINSLSRALEEAFIRHGIRYQIVRGVEFYNRKEIKDVLAYLRVLANPADDVSLLRIINTPSRGIGAATVKRLVELGRKTGRRLFDVLMCEDSAAHLGRSAAKVGQFGKLLGELADVVERPAPFAVESVLSRSGLRAMYGGEECADESARENLDELINATTAFQEEHPEATVRDWLEHAALVSDVDSMESTAGVVTLMTLHAAKGLEFDQVFIVGLEEGLLPFFRRGEEPDLEEERRLCFVGITRGRRRVTLLHVRYRMLHGATQRAVRSPLLDELPHDQIEWLEEERSGRKRHQASPAGRLPDDIAEWQVGTLVRHPVRGLGRIASMQRGARRTHVDVEFTDGDRQSWVLEFSKLERVGFDEVD